MKQIPTLFAIAGFFLPYNFTAGIYVVDLFGTDHYINKFLTQ